MWRPSAKVLGLSFGAALAIHAVFAARGFAQAWGRAGVEGWAGTGRVVQGLLGLALVAAVGRVLLALLPAGPPGSHRPAELPATWATSHLLGVIVLHLERVLFPAGTHALLLLAPWIVLLVLRLVTLPGAMVPRHEVLTERPDKVCMSLRAAAVAWGLALLALSLRAPSEWLGGFLIPGEADGLLLSPFGFSSSDALPLRLLSWLALWILIARGWSNARRAPLGRAIALLFGLLALRPLLYLDVLAAVDFGMGAVFLVPWLRRADRRACCLSAIGFAACVLVGEPTLALAGLLTLVLGSWKAQRRFAAGVALAATVVISLTSFLALDAHRWFQGWYPWSPTVADWQDLCGALCNPTSWGLAWYAIALALLLALVALFRPPPEPSEAGIEEPFRERTALLLLLVLGCLALFPLIWVWGSQELSVHLFPAAALLAGLVWIPAERP